MVRHGSTWPSVRIFGDKGCWATGLACPACPSWPQEKWRYDEFSRVTGVVLRVWDTHTAQR